MASAGSLAVVGGFTGAGAATAQAARVAPDTTIAEVHGWNSVRAYDGVQAWTTATGNGWRVVVRHANAIVTPEAVPAGDSRLKADVGPGPDGDPALAYIRCGKVCRVVVSDLDGGRPVIVAGSEGASSVTIWGRRVVWVRGANAVLTRRLGIPGITRLTGAPQRKCRRSRCQGTSYRSVNDLELNGSQLALIDSISTRSGDETEVRMQSIHGGPQRLVADMTVGEGQQTWIGPAFANGKLFFYRSCPFACPRADGAYRYDPKTKAYAHAPSSYTISGFAIDESGRRAFEVLGLFGDRAEYGDAVTSLILTRVLSFTPHRPPIVKGI